jgi:ribosomal protein L3
LGVETISNLLGPNFLAFEVAARVKKLEVVQANPDRNLLLVKGAVPGARNGLLLIEKVVKSSG